MIAAYIEGLSPNCFQTSSMLPWLRLCPGKCRVTLPRMLWVEDRLSRNLEPAVSYALLPRRTYTRTKSNGGQNTKCLDSTHCQYPLILEALRRSCNTFPLSTLRTICDRGPGRWEDSHNPTSTETAWVAEGQGAGYVRHTLPWRSQA